MPTLATNRKAYRDYEILEEIEAGIELTGSEVKSAKAGQLNLDDAYAIIKGGQAQLLNCYITPYQKAAHSGRDPSCTRRLLLHKDQIASLQKAFQAGNLTIVPLKMYTTRGLVKVKLGLARGKRKYEKKRAQKEREIEHEARREVSYLQNLTEKVQ